jgi:hypothetical protein
MARRRKQRRTAKQKAATRKMIAANRRALRLKGRYPHPTGRRAYLVLSSRKGEWMGKDFEKVNGKVERML